MFMTKKEAKNYYAFEAYEPCPCKSGKKYKFCCYEKSKFNNKTEPYYHPKRIIAEAHQEFNKTDFETCFAFNRDKCSKNIIGAHSLQNNGVLNQIATDNHVYKLSFEITNNLSTLKFDKIGKNQASKFKGFCKDHDKEYFSCIEDTEYTGTDEQNFWFAFRAFCFELHRKERLNRFIPTFFRKRPHATREPHFQMQYKVCKLDLRDKSVEYNRFKEIYENNSYDKLDTFVKILPYKVGFTGTTAVAVNVDITGKRAIDIYDHNEQAFIPAIYISVIPKESTSLIIVSRHVDDTCYESLIENLKQNKDDKMLFEYLSFCLAEYSENVYFSPVLIDNLSVSEKDVIISAFSSSLNADSERRLNTLIKGFKINLFDLKYT
ncbi:YecA family protein [Bacillus cereus]|uniref:YecA family protein n=1 Tax=Bacillus cereus TaxID=1396 RepID=UPI0025B17E10|nr:SEC-C domain-containing protein [Bacillus cereus]WJX07521.1 SEC-C domain-containing protein [Bacillus cereus]